MSTLIQREGVESALNELQEITGLLLSALYEGRPEQDEIATGLREIGRAIAATQVADDLRAEKARLANALARLAKSELEQRQEASTRLSHLQERILILEPSYNRESHDTPAAPAAVGESLDPLTGLPNKVAAENAILALNANPEGAFMVVVYVQRMAHFNARLGDKLGNELLFLTTQRIANALLRPDDQMFRWRGPAFVALLHRPDTLVEVKREVKRVMSTRFQFDLRGGAMLVTPALVAESFAAEAGNCAGLIQEIERFISLPSTCGF